MIRLRRAVLYAMAALGAVVAIITFTPLDYWYATWLSGEWNTPRGDTLIVLSASAGPDGMLSRDTHLRASYAVIAWREGHFRKVVVCGKDAGPALRDFIVFSGVPAESVVIENQSASTRENALYAASLLKHERGEKMLLTSDYHMYRAKAAFRKAGLEVVPFPIPDVRKFSGALVWRWPLASSLALETVKIAYYRWNGWI